MGTCTAPGADSVDCPANEAGYHWNTVRMGGGGFVSGLVASTIEPNLIYARTDVGGAYRWNEATESWVPLLDWASEEETGLLGVESLALDPQNPSRLYMLVGIDYLNEGKSAILRSDDYGRTFEVNDVTPQFTAHGNGMGRQSGERLAVDPHNSDVLLCGTRAHGLFRSTDRGESWAPVSTLDVTTVPNGNGIAFVLFDPDSEAVDGLTQTVYVGVSRAGESNLFVSDDGGTSWEPVPGQRTDFVPQRAVLASTGFLYVTYGNGAGPHSSGADAMDRGAIMQYAPATSEWSDISPLRGDASRAFCGISVDSSNPERLLATTVNTYFPQPWGNGDRIFLSEDGGETWLDLIEEGRVTMDDGGAPWIENHAIHWAGSILIDPFSSERAFVTSGNGIFSTTSLSDPDSVWRFTVAGLEETVPLGVASIPDGPLVTVIGDYDGFVHSDITVSPEPGLHFPPMGTTNGLAMAAASPNILARVGRRLYYSDDFAGTWQELAMPAWSRGQGLALSADGSALLMAMDAMLYRTELPDVAWTASEGIAFETLPIADTVDPLLFYAYDHTSGDLFVSHDGGGTFSASLNLGDWGSPLMRPLPGVEGELWAAMAWRGLGRITGAGEIVESVRGIRTCDAVGFGKALPDGSFPTVYVWGTTHTGPVGLYRSVDAGETWQRINDDAHEYGGLGNGQLVTGDANVFGRVYMSTVGRGLVYGEPAE